MEEDKEEPKLKKEPEDEELAELLEEEEEPEEKETPEETKAEEKTETVEEALVEEEAEEAKPAKREKEKEEEEIVEERTYTVPLGKAWIMPPNKRAPKAMRILKQFIAKHMKLEARKEDEEEEEEPAKLIISSEVNEQIWRRGIQKPPRKIRVRATKDKEGNVTLHLAEGK
ncbi:MAG: 50S ribosomal protein L31e [Candidatus Bathyarchaeota archaeon]|nr:50S ribosomal protein L31e [Candidatus Bathyarchaeota archaeon]